MFDTLLIFSLSCYNSDEPLASAYLQAPKSAAIEVQSFEDPREAFCSVIFQHNSFNHTALCKSISLLDEDLSSLSSCQTAYSLSDLERWTCDAINNEVGCGVDVTLVLVSCSFSKSQTR